VPEPAPAPDTPPTPVVVVLTTVPVGSLGEIIARTLVAEHLAACVTLSAPMTSFYRWRGAIERDEERQVLIKTTRNRVPAVQARIAELHTYDIPEFLVIAVAGGSHPYLDWITASVEPDQLHSP
jgi:periplasmic divalent cation tolerance protein